MKRFFSSRAFKAFMCVIIAVLLGVVVAAFTHSNSTPLSSATATVFHPLQRVSSYLSYKFSNFYDNFKSSATLAKENEELKKQLEGYQERVIDYDSIKDKLDIYEDFLGVKEEHPDFVFASATIISRDSVSAYESFTLNKGTTSKIAVNDPVIYGKNLVGVVSAVTPTTCTVITLANPDMNVGVYETYTKEVGYVSGSGDSSDRIYGKLPGLKKDSLISPNGIVCTTGIGGIYPKDLIVGTVSKLSVSDDGVSTTASIRSAVDIGELSEVFVITSFEGQGIVALTGE